VVAPSRGDRPGAWLPAPEEATAEELERCPFDAGREDRTPPETLRIGEPWQVRVVPNLYPAFERQEVVIHAPDHVRSFADLPEAQLEPIAEAWQRRIEAALDEGFAYVHALVNEGRLAGASLPHSHSQLVWLREAPPLVTREDPHGLERLVARDDLRVLSRGGATALVHAGGAVPYESLVAGGTLAERLAALRELVARLRALEGPFAWNAWLHAREPKHLHFVPRLTALAGIELGAELYVNVVAPETAAERLRSPRPEGPRRPAARGTGAPPRSPRRG
jgi:UDPglucose--hexose-1-phosphate uridylyltransferase